MPAGHEKRDRARNLSAVTDILQRLTGLSPSTTGTAPTASGGSGRRAAGGGSGAASQSPAVPEARKRAYLRAAVRVLRKNTLGAHATANAGASASVRVIDSSGVEGAGVRSHSVGAGGRDHWAMWRDALPPWPLAEVSVRLLLKELNDIVDPPRKLPRFKLHLRRAPTQEVRFWRVGPCHETRPDEKDYPGSSEMQQLANEVTVLDSVPIRN